MINALSLYKPFQWAVIFLAVISVAVADIMLKKAAAHGNWMEAIGSPWFMYAAGLYFVQIGLFIFAFLTGWKLTIIGSLQTVLYAIITLAAGVFLYKESPSSVQMVGILFALCGVVLINWP